jgi:hypothetical protein
MERNSKYLTGIYQTGVCYAVEIHQGANVGFKSCPYGIKTVPGLDNILNHVPFLLWTPVGFTQILLYLYILFPSKTMPASKGTFLPASCPLPEGKRFLSFYY